MNKAPAFQFYASDFLIGVMGLSDEEVGVYIKMLAFQWERGSLPSDPKSIKKTINSRKNPSDLVMSKFPISSDGNRRNLRLEKEREKQESFRESRKRNAEKRWESERVSSARAQNMHCENASETDALQSSVFNLQSSDNTPLPPEGEFTLEAQSQDGSGNQSTRKQARPASELVEIPSILQTDEFLAAWEEWKQHRREIRKKLTPKSASKQLSSLAAVGPAQAARAIQQSIEKGWTGIFPESVKLNGQKSASEMSVYKGLSARDLNV